VDVLDTIRRLGAGGEVHYRTWFATELTNPNTNPNLNPNPNPKFTS